MAVADKQNTEIRTIGNFLKDKKFTDELKKAVPSHLRVERLLRIFTTSIKQNQKLQECSLASLLGSLMQCAQLGLEPGTPLGHAYLVPYNKNCQFIIGYRGMIDLAMRSGKVISIIAHDVYAKDEFNYAFGLEEHCFHRPTSSDRGDFMGAYVIVKLKNGDRVFDYMPLNEIEKKRAKSADYSYWLKNGKSGKLPIWETDFDEMAKKTVIRRLFKYLPVSSELQCAIGLDEAADRGEQDNSYLFDGEFENVSTTVTSTKADELANRISA